MGIVNSGWSWASWRERYIWLRQYVVDKSTSRVPPLTVPFEDIPPIGLLCCPGAEVAVVDEPPIGSSWPKTRNDGIIKDSGSR